MNKKIYANDIVIQESFHPGEFIKDELEAREMKQKELSDKMEIAATVLSEIIHGKRNLTPLLALKLEASLGINAEFWMKLQITYDINLIRNQYASQIERTKTTTAKKSKLSSAVLQTAKVVMSSKTYPAKAEGRKMALKKK
jgi:addiction module HigA family antidote